MKMFGEGRVSWCFAASCIWSGARLKSANIDIEFTLIMYICIFDHTAKGSRNKSLNSILVLLKHSDPKFQGLPVDRWDLLWMSSSCSAPCIATYIYICIYKYRSKWISPLAGQTSNKPQNRMQVCLWQIQMTNWQGYHQWKVWNLPG